MKTCQEVMQLTLGRAVPLLPKKLPLTDVLGLVVAENIISTDSVPSFTNSAMDGFAVRAIDYALTSVGSPFKIKVSGEIQAGQSTMDHLQIGSSYRIMTGAVMPAGFDTVIPFEEVAVMDDWIEVTKCPKRGDHVRLVGEDISVGEVVVSRGRVLKPADIGVLAAIGCVAVPVYPKAVVTIITTGNELIDSADSPGLGQIRDANIYSMCAQARAVGAVAIPHPCVPDELNAVVDVLKKGVAEADVILINGGVSVGDFDYTKIALKNLGAEQVFWRVAQKPGGPLGLWILDGKMIFGIPGNPVAAMIMFEEYVRPVLRKIMGHKYIYRPESIGIMDTDWHKGSADNRVNFLRVIAKLNKQCLHVVPTGLQGSGLLSSMMLTNALAVIPAETIMIPLGGEVLLHLIDEREDH